MSDIFHILLLPHTSHAHTYMHLLTVNNLKSLDLHCVEPKSVGQMVTHLTSFIFFQTQTHSLAHTDLLDSALSSLYSGPLHGIMQGLIDNILKVPAAMQQAKAYLYGSLLYYLTMTKQEVTGGQRGKGEQAGLRVEGMWLRIYEEHPSPHNILVYNIIFLGNFAI